MLKLKKTDLNLTNHVTIQKIISKKFRVKLKIINYKPLRENKYMEPMDLQRTLKLYNKNTIHSGKY